MRIPNDLPVLRGVVMTTLLLSVPVSVAVLIQNHKGFRRASSTPTSPSSWIPTILATDVLALLSITSSILAYAAPALTLTDDEETVNGPPQVIHTTTTGPAVALTLLAGLSLATTSYYSWYTFTAWRGLRGGSGRVPVWQRRFAHFYIWGLHVTPWLACTIPIQCLIREPSYVSVAMWKPSIGFLIIGVGCGCLFICLGMTIILFVVRHTVSLLQDTHHLSPQSTHDLLSLSLKNTAFISVSLLFYAYLWACFLLYEIAYLITITTPPVHLLTLLFVQLCFNCPLPPLAPPIDQSRYAQAAVGEGQEQQQEQQEQQLTYPIPRQGRRRGEEEEEDGEDARYVARSSVLELGNPSPDSSSSRSRSSSGSRKTPTLRKRSPNFTSPSRGNG